jgi:hypothetical protein
MTYTDQFNNKIEIGDKIFIIWNEPEEDEYIFEYAGDEKINNNISLPLIKNKQGEITPSMDIYKYNEDIIQAFQGLKPIERYNYICFLLGCSQIEKKYGVVYKTFTKEKNAT